jgi:hypothetical protein
MTRTEARAALKRQFDGMPAETEIPVTAVDLLFELDKIRDDGEYVKSTRTVIGALKFIEFKQTGVRPATDTLQ